MSGLHIAKDFDLPLDYATSTGGILAKKGAGKSNAAVVMFEAMYAAGIQCVAVDPKGDWWGVRSSGDGKGPGLPVPVFGGRHGDIPLEPTAGAFLADLVLTERLTCVLDVSEFSRADVRRFLLAFADRLYRQADAEPLHLFLEEAHEYLPQRVGGEDAPLVGAMQRIVKQGRFKGLGVTIVSQRSASVNKDVLTQVDTLIMLRTTSPQDRKAVKEWIDVHGESDAVLAELPSLAAGAAWVWAPEWNTLQRIQFLRRSTFDSGATPKVGEVRKAPATLADVDLARIKEQMADTIEKAKADDPKVLRARIKELEKTLVQRERELAEEMDRKPPEVVGLSEQQVSHAQSTLLSMAQSIQDLFSSRGKRLHAEAEKELADGNLLAAAMRREIETIIGALGTGGTAPSVERLMENLDASVAAARAKLAERPAPRRETVKPPVSVASDSTLTGPMRKLLTVLAVYGPRTRKQLAMQAGYSMGGGGFNNPLGRLRSAGMVERGEPIVITDHGLAALGDYDPLPTGQALLDQWFAQLRGPERKILAPLVDAWPNGLSKEELAERAGYDPGGGGFNNPLGRLRTLELVTKGPEIRLTDEFAEAIQ